MSENKVPQWLSYQGNKRKLIPLIMPLIPKSTTTFVDLFGGTGIVGANAYAEKRCKQVVYNDLEYDLTRLMLYMHRTDPQHIVDEQDRLANAFGGEITRENAHLYHSMKDQYNLTRLMPWDEKRGKEDFSYAYDMKQASNLGEDYGEWDLLLFLYRNSYTGTGEWRDNGRTFTASPRLKKAKAGDEKLKRFVEAWSATNVEITSCNFIAGFIPDKQHERPRSEKMDQRFKEIISNLGKKDFVFIDPPYHGSVASYNAKWKRSMEIYLLAFCQTLAERKIPFLMTNNIAWNRTIFTEWIKQFHCYTPMTDSVKLYENKGANNMEVLVSNITFPPSKYKLPDELVKLTEEDIERIHQ